VACSVPVSLTRRDNRAFHQHVPSLSEFFGLPQVCFLDQAAHNGADLCKMDGGGPADRAVRRRANSVEAGRPVTVRQVFYQATVRGLVEKAESGYGKVQTDLTLMRRAGALPYGWLAGNTRWQRKPRTFDGVEQALRDTAFYRKSL
jgi:hypothetical protein